MPRCRMGCAHDHKHEGLVWCEAQLKNVIEIVQSKNAIQKCDSKVLFKSTIKRHSQV